MRDQRMRGSRVGSGRAWRCGQKWMKRNVHRDGREMGRVFRWEVVVAFVVGSWVAVCVIVRAEVWEFSGVWREGEGEEDVLWSDFERICHVSSGGIVSRVRMVSSVVLGLL